jgi:intein/homing endonuclease
MNRKSNKFKFSKSVEVLSNRGCSSVRLSLDKTKESNRLKSDVPLMKWVEVVSSNLTNPTIFLNTENISFSFADHKRKIELPDFLDTFLAEDIGIQIGDGSLPLIVDNRGVKKYVVGCYGNISEDRNYMKNIVIPLKNKLFNINLKMNDHPTGGVCYIKFESKAIFTFYEKIIGLKTGKKKEISIPEIILNAPSEIKLACIRGIADTDFCLSFKKKYKEYHDYPVLHLGCNSKILVKQLNEILKKSGINSNTVFDQECFDKRTGKTYIKHYLFISGKKQLEKWMSLIGFHNSVYVTKYLFWKKFGFYPPKITLQQRISTLNGNTDPDILGY